MAYCSFHHKLEMRGGQVKNISKWSRFHEYGCKKWFI